MIYQNQWTYRNLTIYLHSMLDSKRSTTNVTNMRPVWRVYRHKMFIEYFCTFKRFVAMIAFYRSFLCVRKAVRFEMGFVATCMAWKYMQCYVMYSSTDTFEFHLPHTSQMNLCKLPKCIWRWTYRSELSLNIFGHSSHLKERIPVCRIMCSFIPWLVCITLSQISHLKKNCIFF